MRFRTLLALTVMLVLGMAGTAAAYTPGTAEVMFIHEVTGLGPAAVGISNPTDPDAGAHLGVVHELGDARTTLPAGSGYVLAVTPPDALDEPLAVTEPLELVAGNRYVVRAFPQGDGIGLDVYLSDPLEAGNIRIEHRTGRSETLLVTIRGEAYGQGLELQPGEVEDLTGLVNGRYGVDVNADDDGRSLAAIDHLPVAAGQWTVITIVADGSGIDLQVTGPGSLPASATPSPSPSPTAIRTPSRIETGAGGAAADTGGLPGAALVALGLLAGAGALVALSARSRRMRTLLGLTVVLALGLAGTAAAQPAGEGILWFTNEVTGGGPLAVAIVNTADPTQRYSLDVVAEGGAVQTTLPAGSYRLMVAPPNESDGLASTELTVADGGWHSVRVHGDPTAIRFELFDAPDRPPGPYGTLRVEHRAEGFGPLTVQYRQDGYGDLFEVVPGGTVFEPIPNGDYTLEVTSPDGTVLATAPLPIAPDRTTVVTLLNEGDELRIVVGERSDATPSPSPSPTAIRTPGRIETGAGGAADLLER
jgi:hypothetical protein